MRLSSIFFILITVFAGCRMPTEISIPEGGRKADQVARSFISYLVNGQPDSAAAMMPAEEINDSVRNFIQNSARNLAGAGPKNIRIIEYKSSTGYISSTGKFSQYKISYEYEFEKGNVLFITLLKEKDGKFEVGGFNGEFLVAPLQELTKFTLSNKGVDQYMFLAACLLVPVFVVITFIVMLLSKMRVKKKIKWSLIILFICLPKFMMDWKTNEIDFKLFNLSLFGGGVSRGNLYSPWILNFSVPIGAILFLARRRHLTAVEADGQGMTSEDDLLESIEPGNKSE